MNHTSPGWTWVTYTRVAMAENGAGWDAWKSGKFPLSDGQGIGLSQVLRQNVHFIRGKVPGRTSTGQVLWGWGKTNKSPSQGTIQVHLNQEMQYSKTAEGSSDRKDLLHYSSAQVCLCVLHCLWVNRKMEFWGEREIQQCFLKLWFPAGECKLYGKILRSWGISVVFSTAFAAGLELLSLTYTIIAQTRTPGTAAWYGPKQPPSCLSQESSHKTQAVSLPLRIRLHLYHTLLHWLMWGELLSQYHKDL